VIQPDTSNPIGFQSHIPFVASGAYPVRPGNLVRPLVDGVPAFERIGEAIEDARHSVWLTVAFFAPDFRFPRPRGASSTCSTAR
jgi:cardiolipin synthase A/B